MLRGKAKRQYSQSHENTVVVEIERRNILHRLQIRNLRKLKIFHKIIQNKRNFIHKSPARL